MARSFSLTCGLWMISPVRNTRPIRKALAGLVGVVHGAVDAVAEAELAREVDGEAAGAEREVLGLDPIDERAVIALGQRAGDGRLQVRGPCGR